jgi:hypothetical protein
MTDCFQSCFNFAFNFNLRRYSQVRDDAPNGSDYYRHISKGAWPFSTRDHGGAVQVDPIEPTLKAPGTNRLELQYNEVLSSFAFNFNLRRYTTGGPSATAPARA